MSDLPGTPRRDIDPAVIQDQIEKLTAQVARLLESHETAKTPDPISRHPRCFVIMPFGIQDLEDLYSEFILPVLGDCELECARGGDIFVGIAHTLGKAGTAPFAIYRTRAFRSPASPGSSLRLHASGLQKADCKAAGACLAMLRFE